MSDLRRRIPSVDALLADAAFGGLIERAGRTRVARALREVQDAVRAELGGGEGPDRPTEAVIEDPTWYRDRVRARLDRADRRSLRGVINATGVVLHTNLGRAPLADVAVQAVAEASGYGALEYDLETGARGSRYDHCVGLLKELTGAEDALVVNNNAAAVVLVLNTLAEGRAAVISRGELVEIGGSFRVPEIMARSGSEMREVGSTNRTHLRDYAEALADAAVILKVHRSNFRVEGFTAEAELEELAALAREHDVPVIHDVGSGALLDMTTLGLPAEPTARESLERGAAVVTMSGDKLLGGPQAGIILGASAHIAAMRENPLCRAFRPDKLTLAGLEATLQLYRDPDRARAAIPALRMLGLQPDALEPRARRLARRIADRLEVPATVDVRPTMGAVGGGAYPGVELPGFAVALETDVGADALAAALRAGETPVVGRIQDGALLLDVRTVREEESDQLVAAVLTAISGERVLATEVADPAGPAEPPA